MSTNLNGWHRLWVLLTVLWVSWSILQASVMWTPSTRVRKDEMYRRLPPEHGEMIADFHIIMARHQAHPEDVQPLTFVTSERAINPGPVIEIVRHRVPLIAGLTETEIDALRGAYAGSMAAAQQQKRRRMFVIVLGYAFVPPLVLYALGWGVAWVVRGFRADART